MLELQFMFYVFLSQHNMGFGAQAQIAVLTYV